MDGVDSEEDLDLSRGGPAHPPRRHLPHLRGGLVFKAHRLLYHSTLGLIVIKKKKKDL